jgi:hypothetical protein
MRPNLGGGGAPERPAPDAGREPREERVERCGSVAVRRLVKDDGRALLVYSHVAGRDGGE